jgi:hypothetical protein
VELLSREWYCGTVGTRRGLLPVHLTIFEAGTMVLLGQPCNCCWFHEWAELRPQEFSVALSTRGPVANEKRLPDEPFVHTARFSGVEWLTLECPNPGSSYCGGRARVNFAGCKVSEGVNMPHYADGTEAKVGDLVRGHGHNVKHEIIGRVVNVRPGESCTLSVAHIDKDSAIYFAHQLSNGEPLPVDRPFASVHVAASIEFGDTKGFVKIG